jgi:hypothetical protein
VIDGMPILTTVGPWGLVSMFFILVFLGGLIPRWTHNQRVNDKEQTITYLESMVAKRDEQFDKLIENAEITVRLLEDIKRAAGTAEHTQSRHRT